MYAQVATGYRQEQKHQKFQEFCASDRTHLHRFTFPPPSPPAGFAARRCRVSGRGPRRTADAVTTSSRLRPAPCRRSRARRRFGEGRSGRLSLHRGIESGQGIASRRPTKPSPSSSRNGGNSTTTHRAGCSSARSTANATHPQPGEPQESLALLSPRIRWPRLRWAAKLRAVSATISSGHGVDSWTTFSPRKGSRKRCGHIIRFSAASRGGRKSGTLGVTVELRKEKGLTRWCASP